jgi:hypothetical protein
MHDAEHKIKNTKEVYFITFLWWGGFLTRKNQWYSPNKLPALHKGKGLIIISSHVHLCNSARDYYEGKNTGF